MGVGEVIAIGLVIAAVVIAVGLVRKRARGKGGCGCGCESCEASLSLMNGEKRSVGEGDVPACCRTASAPSKFE